MNEQQFADALGVTRGAVQQWEKEGGTAPTRKNQPKVAKLLGMSVAKLMSGDDLDGNQAMTPAESEQDAMNNVVKGQLSQMALDLALAFDEELQSPRERSQAYIKMMAVVTKIVDGRAALPSGGPAPTPKKQRA